MGYFSWQTADTLESIMCIDAGVGTKPVFLLQPDGEDPIRQEAYEGFGMFGSVDAYVWLGERNLTPAQKAGLDEDTLRDIGIMLDCGSYYVDSVSGERWSVFNKNAQVVDPTLLAFLGRYDEIMPTFGQTPNDLIGSGRLVRHDFSEFVTVPLKFSFDENASYESLHESPRCPHQGYFGDVEDDLEDEFEDDGIEEMLDEDELEDAH